MALVPPFAQMQVSLNGGVNASGAVQGAFGQSLQPSATSTQGWGSARWEIYDFPPGFGLPSGWSLDATTGVYYFAPPNPTTLPPVITLPASGANNWGPFMLRLRVNGNPLSRNTDGSPNVNFISQLTDESTFVFIPSPTLTLGGVGFNESSQRDTLRQWVGSLMKDLRLIDAAGGGGGGVALAGDLGGSLATPRVIALTGVGSGVDLPVGSFINLKNGTASSAGPASGYLRGWSDTSNTNSYTYIMARTGTAAGGGSDSPVLRVTPGAFGILIGDATASPGTLWNTVSITAGSTTLGSSTASSLLTSAGGTVYRQVGTVFEGLTQSSGAVAKTWTGATTITTVVGGNERSVLSANASYLTGQLPTDIEYALCFMPKGTRTYTGTGAHVDFWADTSPNGKVMSMGQSVAANMPARNMPIASSTVGPPSSITMSVAHNLVTGDVVLIDGHATNTAVNGFQTITVTSATTFTVPVTGSGVGGATGTVELLVNGRQCVPINSVAGTGAVPTFLNTGAATAYQYMPQGTLGANYSAVDVVWWCVFRVHSVAGVAADALVYTNDCVFDFAAGNGGMFLQNNGGLFLHYYHFDSVVGVKSAKTAIAVDTWYVAQGRKSGGSLFVKVNAVAETAGTTGVPRTYVAGSTVTIGKTASTTVAANLQVLALVCAPNHIVAADTAANGALMRVRKTLGAMFNIAVN